MAKTKKTVAHLKHTEEIKVELIPVYESAIDFQIRKNEIQDLISKIFISAQKRGRPSRQDTENFNNAA